MKGNILCRLFGHFWLGYTSSITNLKLRACKRCHSVQQYTTFGGFTGFIFMNELKKAGYKEYIEPLFIRSADSEDM